MSNFERLSRGILEKPSLERLLDLYLEKLNWTFDLLLHVEVLSKYFNGVIPVPNMGGTSD